MSDALKFSIGGLLATMRDTMAAFAPSAESQARFTPGSMAPTTISWGANNRTVAIRLPDSAHDNKRIEHRVASADADPGQVIAAILAGVHYGLKNRCDPGKQIHGDASLEQYGLPKLLELAQ
jgi:glutamine synthetase